MINQFIINGVDDQVVMEESGHKWIGKIPKHWKKSKLISCLTNKKQKNNDTHIRNMLSVSQTLGIVEKKYESEFQKRSKEESLEYLVVKPNELVVNKMWIQYRGLGVSQIEGIVSPAYKTYEVNSNIVEPMFLNYLVRSDSYLNEYYRHLKGIRPNSLEIKENSFLRLPLIYPVSTDEQKRIISKIETESIKIDMLIPKIEKLIEKLNMYSHSFIFSAVSGKIDLRNLEN